MTDKVKYYQLHDRDTGAVMHPETSARQVLMPGGTNLDEAFTGLTGTVKGKQNQLADSADVTISTPDGVPPHLSLTDRAKRAVFDDLFLAAAGPWGTIDHTHTNEDGTPSPYYLNELWLTYEEAVAVMEGPHINSTNCNYMFKGVNMRTNIPPLCGGITNGSTAPKFDVYYFIDSTSKIEVLNLTTKSDRFCINPSSSGTDSILFHPARLTKIIGTIDIGNLNGNKCYFYSTSLESVNFNSLKSDLNLCGLPKLNAASVRYLIENKYRIGSAATAAYTVTLHADVYNKIVEAAEGEKASEWSGLLELAASKNITFASA